MAQVFDREKHVFRSSEFLKVVADAIRFLAQSPVFVLPPPETFAGPGVYALYFAGESDLYSTVTEANQNGFVQPIYIGKAVPPGWRQGRTLVSSAPSLHQRLKEHARSIRSTGNLHIKDFACRFVILDDQESNLISTIEAELIRRLTPLWNSVVDGFGNHDPGSGRYAQSPSEWDVLHPGRAWARRLTGTAPAHEMIVAKIAKAMAS